MNISYNWLKELTDIGLSPEALAESLTRVGLAVEGIHPAGDDRILDIDLTSNRPDCLSHLGIAREICATTGKALPADAEKNVDPDAVPYPSVLAPDIVRIEDPDLCHRFTARIIRNVRIGPSPDWLVKRLEAIGERSINNVADITNYVMHELGQPMHAFDLDKLAGNRIVVRRAMPDETITTLDESHRELDGTMLAICDSEKPAALAGIMGGLDSSITDSTVNVLIEVAYFERGNIRQTSRKLNLATEASYRFERGVDICNLKRASDRAAELISELADGEIGDFIDVYPTKFTPAEIESSDIAGSVKRLTGLDVEIDRCVAILNTLGISLQERAEAGAVSMVFVPPSWRHDLAIEEDLVEEIARHAGYENIAEELPPAFGAGEYQAGEGRKKLLRRTLVDLGFEEALSYSFIDTKFDGVYDVVPGLVDGSADDKYITLCDSVIEGAVRMRPTLLPGLLDGVRVNFNHQRRDIGLFEIGKVFAASSGENELPTERELLALVTTGGEINEGRAMPARDLDFYDAKGALEAALNAAGIEQLEFAAGEFAHLRKGQSASVALNGIPIGSIGRLNDEITASYKFKQPVYVAEVDLQSILAAKSDAVVYQPLPKYPAMIRDVSFLVDRKVSYSDIRSAIAELHMELCRSVEFVDVYEGKGVGEDQRSLTIRLEYRSEERTLVESDVDAVHSTIVENLESTLGIRRRF